MKNSLRLATIAMVLLVATFGLRNWANAAAPALHTDAIAGVMGAPPPPASTSAPVPVGLNPMRHASLADSTQSARTSKRAANPRLGAPTASATAIPVASDGLGGPPPPPFTASSARDGLGGPPPPPFTSNVASDGLGGPPPPPFTASSARDGLGGPPPPPFVG